MVVIQIKRKGVWVDWISASPENAEENRARLAKDYGAANVRIR